jgi:hypothetical protein
VVATYKGYFFSIKYNKLEGQNIFLIFRIHNATILSTTGAKNILVSSSALIDIKLQAILVAMYIRNQYNKYLSINIHLDGRYSVCHVYINHFHYYKQYKTSNKHMYFK